ncbi:MAG TPA: FecR domain-containing protein [Mucilaginibacter sp.]|jgi:ferric-dicitrate binding protein FerR (iron transport regulator)|nr:FecR domain-containing protein [Mucilaginibacter sp.]
MPPQLKKDFLKLVEKYLNGSASAEEINTIENYYAQFSNDPDITDSLDENEINALKAALRQKINTRINQVQKRNVLIFKKHYLQWAAAILLFSLLSLFVANWLRHQPITLQAQNHDLAPGGNRATLTLANGSKINLNSTKNGAFTTQPGAHILKQGGQLFYKAAENESSAIPVSYNTLTTPKGGQYQLILADGTKVWLNAASSLKFPTAFVGSERIVELTGEAYFEVAKNAKQPFKVKTSGQIVQDIGTRFDVNSYTDEDAVTTTLVEGSVKIYDAQGQTLIRPGQQYLSKMTGLPEVKTDVDIDEVTAWKSGMFQFDDADIKTIMRQISRWYNVDVEYLGQLPASTYHGRISRNSNASTVLKILELSGINFTIERGKIIVK